MKKILLILSIALLVISANAQTISPSGNSNYYPYSGFNNDTLRYLKTNFETNKNSYIGKTVKSLLDDIELKIYSGSFDVNDVKQVYALNFKFISKKESFYRSSNNRKIVFMNITFEQPIKMIEIDALINKIREKYSDAETNNEAYWSSLHVAFYGGRIIKNIEVYEMDFSEP